MFEADGGRRHEALPGAGDAQDERGRVRGPRHGVQSYFPKRGSISFLYRSFQVAQFFTTTLWSGCHWLANPT